MTPVTAEEKTLDPRVARSRAKMLDAATELLVESGPRSVTVDAVAERSGVAKSTLYRHWASRQDLLVGLFRSHQPELPELPAELGFEDALVVLVGSIENAMGDPNWRKVLPALLSMRSHMPEVAEIFDEDQAEHLLLFASVLERGVAEGRVPAGTEPALLMNLLVGPLVLAGMTEKAPLDEVAAYVIERFLASYS